jgi:beta-glucosidase
MPEISPSFGFPPGFLFGTATSATQVEGGCTNTDWWAFAREPGRVQRGDTPDRACEEWDRWPADFALQKSLKLNAYRLSIEWGRVEPRPGVFDMAALDRYRAMLGALVDAGIDPMVTLHHFSLPLWQSRRGGFLDRALPGLMERYALRVVEALGELCQRYVTINEPSVVSTFGYLFGLWPPGRYNLAKALQAQHNLLAAHLAMYRAIKARLGAATQVGVAHHLRVFAPVRPGRWTDRAGASFLRWAFNDAFARALCEGTHYGPFGAGLADEAKGTHDFFGLNYYTRDLVRFDLRRPGDVFLPRRVVAGAEVNDLGWEVYPEGLGQLLRSWSARAGVPIYVTENGIADASDLQRPSFLVRHLAEIAQAIARGIDVRGYYHWSLLDNFEWAEGYSARFGLVAVDFQTQSRTIRPSASLYARIAAASSIDAETWQLYKDPPAAARRAASIEIQG